MVSWPLCPKRLLIISINWKDKEVETREKKRSTWKLSCAKEKTEMLRIHERILNERSLFIRLSDKHSSKMNSSYQTILNDWVDGSNVFGIISLPDESYRYFRNSLIHQDLKMNRVLCIYLKDVIFQISNGLEEFHFNVNFMTTY